MDLAGRLASAIAPEIPTAYGATDAGLISMLLMILAKEAQSGIDNRHADGRELAGLFETATQAPGRDARQSFQASEPASYSHNDVSAWLDEGLSLLIELHSWAELEDPELDRRIWDFLVRHTERHKIDL